MSEGWYRYGDLRKVGTSDSLGLPRDPCDWTGGSPWLCLQNHPRYLELSSNCTKKATKLSAGPQPARLSMGSRWHVSQLQDPKRRGAVEPGIHKISSIWRN